jgi:hypothetical protein
MNESRKTISKTKIKDSQRNIKITLEKGQGQQSNKMEEERKTQGGQ